MTIRTKDGLTLELPDNAEVQIDGDKITVKPSQVQLQPIPVAYPWWWANPYSPYQISYGNASGGAHVPACGIPQATGWTVTSSADANSPYTFVQTGNGSFTLQ